MCRQERKAKHEQWYNKNLSSAFVKKRSEVLQRESEKVEPAFLSRLGAQNRVAIIVASQVLPHAACRMRSILPGLRESGLGSSTPLR